MSDSDDTADHVPVPEEFFSETLPRISDLAELKVTLYVMQLARERQAFGVSFQDLLVPEIIHSVVGRNSPEPGEVRLRRVLDRAVANGFLLRLTDRSVGRSTLRFLPSTLANRRLVEQLRAGEPDAARRLNVGEEVAIYRPNVFALYEQHIGPLTPLIAEQLRDAERSYPRAWIEDAILEAAHYNKRTWRYVESILSQWEAAGGPRGVSGGRG